MKLKNGEIFQAIEPMKKLMQEKMPVKVSWQLAKLINKLNEPLKAIDDVRNGLIKQYGIQDGGGQIKVEQKTKDGKDNPKFQKFVTEMNELFEQEVEVVFDKVKLPERVASTCDACHHNMDRPFEVEPSILMALEKFVEVA